MKTLLTILCLALPGCYPKAIVIEPIAPAVTHAAATAKAASASAKRVSESAITTAASATSLGFELAKATEFFAKQKADPRIPEDVALLNWQTVQQLAAKSLETERKAKAAVAESIAHEADADAVTKENAELAKKAIEHDKGVKELQIKEAKEAEDAGKWHMLRSIGWTLTALSFAAIVAVIIFRYGAGIVKTAKTFWIP